MLTNHLIRMACQLVDSALPTTRVYWRTKFYQATEAEAIDPRAWRDVLADRAPSDEIAR